MGRLNGISARDKRGPGLMTLVSQKGQAERRSGRFLKPTPSGSMREAPKELEIDQPSVLLGHLALFERDQSRNAANAEARRNRRLLVDIDLGEAGARFELLCRLVEDRRHRAARPAPWRPEVDDQRHVVALDVLVDRLRRQRYRLAGEQVRLAGPACRLRGRPVGGDAVDCRAMGTDDVAGFGHGTRPLDRACQYLAPISAVSSGQIPSAARLITNS